MTKQVKFDENGNVISITHKHNKSNVNNDNKKRESRTMIYNGIMDLSKQFHNYYRQIQKIDRDKAGIVDTYISRLIILSCDMYFNNPDNFKYYDLLLRIKHVMFLIRDLRNNNIILQKHQLALNRIIEQIETNIKDKMEEISIKNNNTFNNNISQQNNNIGFNVNNIM